MWYAPDANGVRTVQYVLRARASSPVASTTTNKESRSQALRRGEPCKGERALPDPRPSTVKQGPRSLPMEALNVR